MVVSITAFIYVTSIIVSFIVLSACYVVFPVSPRILKHNCNDVTRHAVPIGVRSNCKVTSLKSVMKREYDANNENYLINLFEKKRPSVVYIGYVNLINDNIS